jgi:hypothetical protein
MMGSKERAFAPLPLVTREEPIPPITSAGTRTNLTGL